MQAGTCRCGTRALARADRPDLICDACLRIELAPSATNIGLAETLPAMAPVRSPSLVRPPRGGRSAWPLVLGAGIVVGAIVVAVGVFALRDKPAPVVVQPGPPKPPEPAPPPLPRPADLHTLVNAQHRAIAHGDEAALGALLAPSAFGFGVDATETPRGPEIATTITRFVGTPPKTGFDVIQRLAKMGIAEDVAWILEELVVGGRNFSTTQVALRTNGTWQVAAWHWAVLVDNKRAAKLARTSAFKEPQKIESPGAADRELESVFRAAFESRDQLAATFSERTDALYVGSAPGEVATGGKWIRQLIQRDTATIAIHDGVAVARLTDRAGWGAANIDYTIMYGKSPLTQTFRVLAVFVKEQLGWRIVQLHWSNAGPLPP